MLQWNALDFLRAELVGGELTTRRNHYLSIPANFFWDISVRFLSWECWDFWRRHDHFRRFPKKSEVFRRRPKSAEVCQRRARSQCFTLQKPEIARKVLPFIHLTHGFRSLHGSELTYFGKLCQAGRQQLTFFNQAWEIGPQAWAGVRSKFSTRRRESWQVYLSVLWHSVRWHFSSTLDQDTLIQWLFPPRKVFLKTRCSVNNWSIKDAWLYLLYLDTIQSKFDRKKITIEILNKRKWTLYVLQLLTL